MRALPLCRKPLGATAIAIAVALQPHPVAAAETPASDQASEAGKPETKSDKSDTKARDTKGRDKAAGKEADKSGDKGDKSQSPPEAEAESKPDDPCDPTKQLVNFALRDQLCKSGVKLGVTETSEVLGNLTGGLRQGALYEGVTDLNLNIDFRPSFHWRGNVFARAYQIHGRGLTLNNTDNLNEISAIEALRTTRLVELWYEHHFDNWRVRIGQQTVGNEFLNPDSARLFVNGTFGWPTQPSLDLPTGGPGYPLGTPAIRLRVDPEEGLTWFLALFNGDPTGAGVGGSQLRDASGTAFRTSDGAWVVGEVRYNPDSSDAKGTYRFGGWWNSERFRDLRFDTNGVPLASPLSNGTPRRHEGDISFYGIIDQPLLTNAAEHTRLSVFARAGIAPGDRNLIDVYADGGLTYKGPFGRADDQAGIAIGYARISDAAQGFDADVARLTGQFHPIRSGEVVLELTYRFQLTSWWQLQPDFQYIFNPGGGIVNPNVPNRRLGDEAVVGLRTAVTF
jgi:porin